MLTEELRARIGLINRNPRLHIASELPSTATDLESLVPGEVMHEGGGPFYRVCRSIAALQATSLADLARDYVEPDELQEFSSPDLTQFATAFPTRVAFLDLETCGFSGAPVFLIGLLRRVDGDLAVEQLLARNYTEEPATLHYLWRILAAYDVLVTFNGKSFDWPFLLDRSVALRLPNVPHAMGGGRHDRVLDRKRESTDSIPRVHCDILHFARRFWKAKHGLPNCRLQTLESALCRRQRHGDIPGYLIGDAYHRFVRSGNARQMRQILYHNAADLITLAELSLLLVREIRDGVPATGRELVWSCTG